MSTRATYLISAGDWTDQKICFYIHHDGYPEGAAHYFLNMHQFKNERGGYAGKFFRANENAEFSDAHEDHGNNEYCYTLDNAGQLTVLKRDWDSEKWQVIYSGLWSEFVNQELKFKKKECLYNFKRSAIYSQDNTPWIMTLAEAETYVSGLMKEVGHAFCNGWTGNAENIRDQAKFLQQQIDVFKKNL